MAYKHSDRNQLTMFSSSIEESVPDDTPGRADTLTMYDELGQQTFAGLDMNNDGALTATTPPSSRYAFEPGSRGCSSVVGLLAAPVFDVV